MMIPIESAKMLIFGLMIGLILGYGYGYAFCLAGERELAEVERMFRKEMEMVEMAKSEERK